MNEKEAFISGYISCALWSSSDTHPLTGKFVELNNYELAQGVQEKLEAYAGKAFDEQYALWDRFVNETGTDYSQAGHSFWLSTNGHGAGLFDFTQSPAAKKLDDMCGHYGGWDVRYCGFDLYLGDDCLIYVS